MDINEEIHRPALSFTRSFDGDELNCTPQYLDSDDGVIENPEFYRDDALDRELAELDDLLDEIEDEPKTESPLQDNSTEDRAVHLPDISGMSAEAIIKLQKERFSGDFDYNADDKSLNRNIAIELTKLGVSPFERAFPKSDSVACHKASESDYMLDIQSFDLYWVWVKHKGHLTDNEAYGGLFSGIFNGDQFDFEQARKIAAAKIRAADKAEKFLRFPECWQMELAVLRTDAVRQRQHEARKRITREQKELADLQRKAIDIRHRLEDYKKRTPRARLNVDVYANVWVAREMAGNSRIYLIDTAKNYENLTGKSINKQTLRDILKALRKALEL